MNFPMLEANAQVKVAAAVSSLYISVIAYLTIWDDLDALPVLLPLMAGCYVACLAIAKAMEGLEFALDQERPASFPLGFYMAMIVLVLAGQMLYWLAYYPGGFNLDAYGQWDQVHGLMALNNWHPVLTTALYWLLTRVCDSFAFCIFVQIAAFSLSASYLLACLRGIGVPKALLVIAGAYIAFNPAIAMNNICLFKDVPFAIVLIWVTVMLMRVVLSRGAWLERPLHLAMLGTCMLALALIRHNGVFFVLPALVCLALFYRSAIKRVLLTSIALAVSLALIQGPLLSALSVEKHDNPVGEMVGIPMAIMANLYVSSPEETPVEVESFLLTIAERSEWESKYLLGEWDSCKWDFDGIYLLQDDSLIDVLKLTLSSVSASPELAYQSIRENTRVVWQVAGAANWDTWVYVEENCYGIAADPNPTCKAIALSALRESVGPLGSTLCWNIGVFNVAMALLSVRAVARKEHCKLLLMLPPVTYNLLTMLLLCGPSHRYFYYCSVLLIPIVLFTLYGKSFEGRCRVDEGSIQDGLDDPAL